MTDTTRDNPQGAPIEPATEAALARAAALLRQGRLVVFPTETVYGLGADATSDAAIARLYAAKNRPPRNPLIVHLAGLDAVEPLVRLDAATRRRLERLAAAFWPGPMTLVLPMRPGAVSPLATAGLATLGVRVPAHPVAAALLRLADRPIAAPSANRSGQLSPTTAEAAAEQLGGAVDLILDGGPCAVGVESTIIDLSGDRPCLLRPGGVPREALDAAIGERLALGPTDDARPSAPGQLTSHYAPRAQLRLDAAAPRQGEAWLGFGPDPEAAETALARETLSATGDLEEAAARLFAALRALDARLASRPADQRLIAVAPVPEQGLGAAINDRLRRAAAPRPARSDP